MTINLHNPNLATAAAEWCKCNKIDYQLEFWGWPGSKVYKFVFNNHQDMVLFSLKWAQ